MTVAPRRAVLMMLTNVLLNMIIPLVTIIGVIESSDPALNSPSFLPLALQYLVIFLATLTTILSAQVYLRRIVQKFGVANSELSETVNLFRRVVNTASLYFFSSLFLEVKFGEMYWG